MPVINVEMLEGRTDQQLAAYVAALTDITCQHLGCSREGVSVILHDVAPSRYAIAGRLLSERLRSTDSARS